MDAKLADSAVSSGQVLIVIVNYKTAALTIACLQSLVPEIADDASIRVAVVENDSGDAETLANAIHEHGWGAWATLIVAERNGGFAYGNNRGMEAALAGETPPDFVMLLNSDTEVRLGAIRHLKNFLQNNPKAGIAGSGFENPDGSDWPIAFRFPTAWSQFEQGIRFGPVSRLLKKHIVARTMPQDQAAEVDWVSGASLMMRRQVIEEIGLMDEAYFLYFEELDWCLQARRAGWSCWYVPQSRVMHLFGQSTGVSSSEKKLKRMPAYWFDSRTRYFLKNHGLAYARLADLAYGIGLAFCTFRQWVTRKPSGDPPGFLADFWRTSVLLQNARTIKRHYGI